MQEENLEGQTVETIHQLVAFQLGEEGFGIDIFRVNEIIRLKEITPLPGTDAHIKGLINLRGKTIPVIDLRLRLGMPSVQATDASRIIVVNVGAENIGVIVDAVTEVLNLTDSDLQATPDLVSEVNTEFIWSLAKRHDRILTLLNLDQAIAA
jgi:purine-binding chemotaxis protein CheW